MKIVKLSHYFIILLLSFITFYSQANQETVTPIISQQALISQMSLKENAIVVLDVRTPEEFAQGHIKNAINISHNKVLDNIDALFAHKDKTIVVHCRSGRRAVSAEQILRDAGFKDVRHLAGDMNAWQAADLPLEK